jgi:hypothetical protein
MRSWLKSWKQPLTKMQGKITYTRPKSVGRSDPSLDPVQVGAACIGQSFITGWPQHVLIYFVAPLHFSAGFPLTGSREHSEILTIW